MRLIEAVGINADSVTSECKVLCRGQEESGALKVESGGLVEEIWARVLLSV
jgi:hypothetical protein